jgi:hypothetical protein
MSLVEVRGVAIWLVSCSWGVRPEVSIRSTARTYRRSGVMRTHGLRPNLAPRFARKPDEVTAWWMTGARNQLYFYILYKGTQNGAVKLQKLSGNLEARNLCVRPCWRSSLCVRICEARA